MATAINDTLIICEGDKFIALDSGSGGYPRRVNPPWQATHWRTTREVIEYRDKFPKEQWTIKVFRATALWEVGKNQ